MEAPGLGSVSLLVSSIVDEELKLVGQRVKERVLSALKQDYSERQAAAATLPPPQPVGASPPQRCRVHIAESAEGAQPLRPDLAQLHPPAPSSSDTSALHEACANDEILLHVQSQHNTPRLSSARQQGPADPSRPASPGQRPLSGRAPLRSSPPSGEAQESQPLEADQESQLVDARGEESRSSPTGTRGSPSPTGQNSTDGQLSAARDGRTHQPTPRKFMDVKEMPVLESSELGDPLMQMDSLTSLPEEYSLPNQLKGASLSNSLRNPEEKYAAHDSPGGAVDTSAKGASAGTAVKVNGSAAVGSAAGDEPNAAKKRQSNFRKDFPRRRSLKEAKDVVFSGALRDADRVGKSRWPKVKTVLNKLQADGKSWKERQSTWKDDIKSRLASAFGQAESSTEVAGEAVLAKLRSRRSLLAPEPSDMDQDGGQKSTVVAPAEAPTCEGEEGAVDPNEPLRKASVSAETLVRRSFLKFSRSMDGVGAVKDMVQTIKTIPKARWRDRIPFDPANIYRRLWDVMVFMLLFYYAYQIPYKMALPPRSEGSIDLYDNIDLFALAVFSLDIVLNFLTAFPDANGQLVRTYKEIAIRYAKSWLWLDVLATLPYDLMLGGGGDDDSDASVMDLLQVGSMSKIARFARLLRVLRLLRLIKISARLESAMNPSIMRLIKLLFLVTVISHWFSCVLIIIAKETSEPDRWLLTDDFLGMPTGLQYTISLYWTFGTMLGNMGAAPQSLPEVTFTLIVLLIGIVVYTSAFGNLVTLMNNMDASTSEYKEMMDKNALYMRKLRVPEALQKRIQLHYEQMYERTHGVNVQKFLTDLPWHLRQEIAMFLNRGVLESMKLFNDCSINFITAILMRLKLAIFLKGELLCCEGDIGEEMYFIIVGQLAVWKGGQAIGMLSEGSFFGEGALVTESAVRSASVRAASKCTLYSLARSDYEYVATSYPADSVIFTKVALERRRATEIVE